MKLLHSYLNGNVQVEIFDDGTKTQEWPGDTHAEAKPIYPNSMDVKITNYCDLGCDFCHEESTTKGKHGDLSQLASLLRLLPGGTELAIGGGNPLDHPDLKHFLEACKGLNLIPNMTVNYRHIPKFHHLINELLDKKLIYGLGISIDDKANPIQIENLLHTTKNVVYHIIVGVEPVEILNKYMDRKVLILGYKDHGRGIRYRNIKVTRQIKDWDKLIFKLGKFCKITSFDNLAVKQLHLADRMPKKYWDKHYMGTDGQFTMYIDAVNMTYATSSTSEKQFSINSDIGDIFQKVRLINVF